MQPGEPTGTFTNRLTGEMFGRLSALISEECGIRMPDSKKTMLEARLSKRMHEAGFKGLDEYLRYLFSPDGASLELKHMIDSVTTNKTDFFREPQHFEYLVEKAVPELVRMKGSGIRTRLAVWSAACSSGEEPYTLAMVLGDFAMKTPGFDYMVLGTDISTRMLDRAARAVYEEERIAAVPIEMRRRYLLRSRDPSRKLVRMAPEIRAKVQFRRLNFIDEDYRLRERMDVVFCRNVLIYFDRQTQEKVLTRLCRHLAPGGFLFTGHSESISGMDLPLKMVANTISRRI
jgi:chemotaxis protein methyltransferase CheR